MTDWLKAKLGRMRVSTAVLIAVFIALFSVHQTFEPQRAATQQPVPAVVPPGFVPDPNYTWVPRTNVREQPQTTTTPPTTTTTTSPTETTSPTSPTETPTTTVIDPDGTGPLAPQTQTPTLTPTTTLVDPDGPGPPAPQAQSATPTTPSVVPGPTPTTTVPPA